MIIRKAHKAGIIEVDNRRVYVVPENGFELMLFLTRGDLIQTARIPVEKVPAVLVYKGRTVEDIIPLLRYKPSALNNDWQGEKLIQSVSEILAKDKTRAIGLAGEQYTDNFMVGLMGPFKEDSW